MLLTNNSLHQILSYFSYNKIVKLYNNQQFWRYYLNQKYQLNLTNNLDYRALASKVDNLLTLLKTKNLVISLRLFKYIIVNIVKFDNLFTNLNDCIVDSSIILDIYHNNLVMDRSYYDIRLVNINFQFKPGDNVIQPYSTHNIKNALTDVGKINYCNIIKTIMVPTSYINGDDIVKVINFDSDIASNILRYDLGEDFADLMILAFMNIRYNCYLQYFS